MYLNNPEGKAQLVCAVAVQLCKPRHKWTAVISHQCQDKIRIRKTFQKQKIFSGMSIFIFVFIMTYTSLSFCGPIEFDLKMRNGNLKSLLNRGVSDVKLLT